MQLSIPKILSPSVDKDTLPQQIKPALKRPRSQSYQIISENSEPKLEKNITPIIKISKPTQNKPYFIAENYSTKKENSIIFNTKNKISIK